MPPPISCRARWIGWRELSSSRLAGRKRRCGVPVAFRPNDQAVGIRLQHINAFSPDFAPGFAACGHGPMRRDAVPTRQRRDHFDFHVRCQRRYAGSEQSGYPVPPMTDRTANRILDLAVNGEQSSDPLRVACGYREKSKRRACSSARPHATRSRLTCCYILLFTPPPAAPAAKGARRLAR